MSQIKRRVQNNTYKSVEGFANDFKQMFANARIFNEEGSWVWNDAQALEAELEELWGNFVVGSGLPGAPPAASGPIPTGQTSTADASTPSAATDTDAGGKGPKKLMLKFGKKQPAAEPAESSENSASDSEED